MASDTGPDWQHRQHRPRPSVLQTDFGPICARASRWRVPPTIWCATRAHLFHRSPADARVTPKPLGRGLRMPTHHRERRRTINASAGSEHPSPKRANAKTASLGPEHPTSWISLHATQHEVLNTAQNEGPGCFGKVIGWPWVTSRGPRAPMGPGQFLKVSDPEIPRWQHPPRPTGAMREPFRNKVEALGVAAAPDASGKSSDGLG